MQCIDHLVYKRYSQTIYTLELIGIYAMYTNVGLSSKNWTIFSNVWLAYTVTYTSSLLEYRGELLLQFCAKYRNSVNIEA